MRAPQRERRVAPRGEVVEALELDAVGVDDLVAALFQPRGKVRARPGPSGEALCMAAPCKRHGGNDATRSLCV